MKPSVLPMNLCQRFCRNAKELHCSQMHGRVPLIGDLSERCTSGLVTDHQVKSTLRASLLKGDHGNARMWLGGSVSHLVAEALWALMHIKEIGYYHTLTVLLKLSLN